MIRFETNGRKCCQLSAVGDDREGFNQKNNSLCSLCIKKLFKNFCYTLTVFAMYLQTTLCFFQNQFDVTVFRKMKKLFSPEIFIEMRNANICKRLAAFFKIR